MSHRSSGTDARMSHETIAEDIAEFRAQGGKIEVLGDTPVRKFHASPFRSRKNAAKGGNTASASR